MKTLATELRLYFAELLLGWAFSVAPKGRDGAEIKMMLAYYFSVKVKHQPPSESPEQFEKRKAIYKSMLNPCSKPQQ